MHVTYPSPFLSQVPLSDRSKQDLVSRMTAPSRHYHVLDHLNLLWDRHLQYRNHILDVFDEMPEALIASAIAYHDAVYVAGDPDNERRSAELWLEVSASASDLSLEERLWVADTIRATANHIAAAATLRPDDRSDIARLWMIELDLTPLGEEPEVFDRNMQLLNAEAVHVAPEQRQAGVLEGLRGFASARPLYRSLPLAQAFNDSARRNFARHLPNA
jgi:predicted metal-dependent HD superfamily phosphohydrolase